MNGEQFGLDFNKEPEAQKDSLESLPIETLREMHRKEFRVSYNALGKTEKEEREGLLEALGDPAKVWQAAREEDAEERRKPYRSFK